MKFHEFRGIAGVVAKHPDLREFADSLAYRNAQFKATIPEHFLRFGSHWSVERKWMAEKRPYYNVWPTIIPMLRRIKLDFPASMLKLPGGLQTLSIRLPEVGNPYYYRSVLISEVEERTTCTQGLTFLMDCGETVNSLASHFGHENVPSAADWPVFDYICFPCSNEPIDSVLARAPNDTEFFVDQSNMKDMVSLAAALMMIDQGDRNLIQPDVLNKDDAAYHEALHQFNLDRQEAITDRAFRRRGPGWNIGLAYETQQHGPTYVVPPHPQRYWVGKGRSEVVIKVRKGYIVHEQGVTTMPTGYSDDSGI